MKKSFFVYTLAALLAAGSLQAQDKGGLRTATVTSVPTSGYEVKITFKYQFIWCAGKVYCATSLQSEEPLAYHYKGKRLTAADVQAYGGFGSPRKNRYSTLNISATLMRGQGAYNACTSAQVRLTNLIYAWAGCLGDTHDIFCDNSRGKDKKIISELYLTKFKADAKYVDYALESKLKEAAQKEEKQKQYNDLIDKANDLFGAGDYKGAKSSAEAAKRLLPEGGQHDALLQKIEEAIKKQEKEEEIKKLEKEEAAQKAKKEEEEQQAAQSSQSGASAPSGSGNASGALSSGRSEAPKKTYPVKDPYTHETHYFESEQQANEYVKRRRSEEQGKVDKLFGMDSESRARAARQQQQKQQLIDQGAQAMVMGAQMGAEIASQIRKNRERNARKLLESAVKDIEKGNITEWTKVNLSQVAHGYSQTSSAAPAAFALGTLYEIEQDYPRAYGYYSLAGEWGYYRSTANAARSKLWLSPAEKREGAKFYNKIRDRSFFGYNGSTGAPLGISFGQLNHLRMGWYMSWSFSPALFVKHEELYARELSGKYAFDGSSWFGGVPDRVAQSDAMFGINYGFGNVGAYGGMGWAFRRDLYKATRQEDGEKLYLSERTAYADAEQVKNHFLLVEMGLMYKWDKYFANSGVRMSPYERRRRTSSGEHKAGIQVCWSFGLGFLF